MWKTWIRAGIPVHGLCVYHKELWLTGYSIQSNFSTSICVVYFVDRIIDRAQSKSKSRKWLETLWIEASWIEDTVKSRSLIASFSSFKKEPIAKRGTVLVLSNNCRVSSNSRVPNTWIGQIEMRVCLECMDWGKWFGSWPRYLLPISSSPSTRANCSLTRAVFSRTSTPTVLEI